MIKLFTTKKGKPVPDFSSSWTYLTDENGLPCLGEIYFENEYLVIETQEKNVALNLLYEIEGFGKVMVRTSRLPHSKTPYNLHEKLYLGRISAVEEELKKMKRESIKPPKNLIASFSQLKKLKSAIGMDSNLAKLMHLGEKFVLYRAKVLLDGRIKKGETKNFKFGGQAFGIEHGSLYQKRFLSLYQYATVPIYFFLTRPEKDKTDWTLTDKIVAWLFKENIPIKGHPLVWFHQAAIPSWMKELTFRELKQFIKRHVRETVSRYKNKIKFWDICNEFPTLDANSLNLSVNQLLELLQIISRDVKRIQPEAFRVINISDIFGGKSYIHESPSIPPIYFLKQVIKRNIGFEAIGLQFYTGLRKEFALREFLDISRQIDEYVQLGKELHLTECELPSKHDVDPGCFFSSDHPEVAGYWHKRWSEEIQAEYLKNLLTVFSSKSHTKAFTWWTLTDKGVYKDIGSRFMPWGGLLRRDLSPKPAFFTIKAFQELLGTAKNL